MCRHHAHRTSKRPEKVEAPQQIQGVCCETQSWSTHNPVIHYVGFSHRRLTGPGQLAPRQLRTNISSSITIKP
jgi:hypothetical protein